MRLFYGISCPDSIREQLQIYQERAGMACSRGKWTRPENFHITLYFAGEVPETMLGHHKQVLHHVSVGVKPFVATIAGFGSFPKKNRCILWAGASLPEQVTNLSRQLHQNLAESSMPWHLLPHLTLGRECVQEQFPDESGLRPLSWEVREIHLMESLRIDNVLTYRPVETAVLKEYQDNVQTMCTP